MVSTIMFDLNQVLVTFTESDLEDEHERRVGISQHEFWQRATRHFDSYNEGELHLQEFMERVFEDEGLDPAGIPAAIELYRRSFTWVPGMQELLSEVSAQYPCILLAGDGFESYYYKVKHFGLQDYFIAKYCTCFERRNKEDPQIYRNVLNRQGLQPEDVLFIDDLSKHTGKASELGLQCIRFTDTQQLRRELADRGLLPAPQKISETAGKS